MIKTILDIGLLFAEPSSATIKCSLVTENNEVIQKEGDCKTRHSPCSTFKIAISLMAYNEGLLTDETHPVLPFKKGYTDWRENWKQPHTPTTWMKNSCVWYSRVLTEKLGVEKFRDYVTKFNYGNQDVSGDKGHNNVLINSWICSSLQISPEEQVGFLQKLVDHKLPVSIKAQEITKNILFVEELADGWQLYGKTGAGIVKDGIRQSDYQIGWFIGWIQKDKRTIVFAYYLEDPATKELTGGIRARQSAKESLKKLIKSEQK